MMRNMKVLVPDIDRPVSVTLTGLLLMLYACLTYAGMYTQSPASAYVETRLFALLISTMATLWLYWRCGRFLDKAIDAKSLLQIARSRIHLIPKHLCLTLGIWTGGSLSLSATRNPILGWLLGIVLVLFPYNKLRFSGPDFSMKLLRGSYMRSMPQAHMRLRHIIQKGDELILWAGLLFPEWITAGHLMIIGAVNSGKTVLMRLLMRTTLCTIQSGSDRRAIIFDAKKNILPLLAGMEVTCPIVILNPFHRDSYALDLAEDVDTPAAASEVARILVKDSKADNPFWTNAARDLLGGVMKALIVKKPRNWTLVEVLDIVSDLQRTKKLLLSVPLTAYLVDLYLNADERTLSNIRSTIAASIAGLREIANLWANTLRANPDRKISLRQWIHQESILVLGNDDRHRGPMEAVNEVLMSLLTDVVLSLEDSNRRRIMLFYDEFQEGGVHRSMLRLLTQGRSKGFWALLVFHTLPGLQSKYGDKEAHAIATTCTNKAFLRQDCPETARWAAQILGKAELLEYTRSHADARYGGNYSMTEHVVQKDVVMPSQLLRLPPANRRRFFGYFTCPAVGVFGGPVHFSDVLAPLADVPNFKERPVEDQYYRPDVSERPEQPKRKVKLTDIPRITRKVLLEALNNDNSHRGSR